MSSKIQQALAKATEVEPKKDETIVDQSYMKRLALAVGELSDKDWDKLDGDQQDWTNAAADNINAKKDVEVYADYVKPAEEPSTRRRRAAADDESPAASASYTPKKGDKVKATTKRGKVYEGTVVDPDDNGELVLDDGKEELGIGLDGLTIEQVVEAEPTSRRRKAAEEPEPPAEPEVSDTVEIKTKRGKIVVGNVVEIDEKTVVIKDTAGEEEEFDIDRLESITVKVKNAGKKAAAGKADPEPAKGKKDEPEAGKRTKTTKDENGGVSVTTRARELMVENLDADKDKIIGMLKKEGLEFKENTIQLIYGDVHKLIGMLKARKMMK